MSDLPNAMKTCISALAICIAIPTAQAQEGQTIVLDGYDTNVVTAGWDHVESGTPTVVFEGGSTLPIQLWEPVLNLVAESAPVVAFDPPGVGRSEWTGERPTIEHMNRRLRQLLDLIEASPPYVLVGHSWASWIVRGYEGLFPEDVAGLVLIDPTPPNSQFMASFQEIGAGEAGMDEFNQMMQRMSASWPPPMRAQQQVIAAYEKSRSDPDVPSQSSVPVAVVVAGSYGNAAVPDSLQPSFDLERFFEVLRRRQITAPVEWVRASPNGTFVLANESGHCVHCDDPELVAWAIQRVLSVVGSNP